METEPRDFKDQRPYLQLVVMRGRLVCFGAFVQLKGLTVFNRSVSTCQQGYTCCTGKTTDLGIL